MAMAAEPWFTNNELTTDLTRDSLAEFFDFVIRDRKTKKPVGTSIVKNSFHKMTLFTNRIQNTLYHRLGIEKRFL
jgi:hypothetical protein